MTREWFDVGVPKTPKKRTHGRRDRVPPEPEEETIPEAPVDARSHKRHPKVVIETETPEIEDSDGRGDHEDRGKNASPPTCVGCGSELICKKCDTSIEAQAQKVMDDIGARFIENIKSDRVKAFEEYVKDILSNQGLLVSARIISLDRVASIMSSVHTMIGAPKKKTETTDEEPLKIIKNWLNGEYVKGVNDPVPLEAFKDEEVEVENVG